MGDGQARRDVADLIAEGTRKQWSDPGFRRELAAWTIPNWGSRRDGIPGYALGFGSIMSLVSPLVMRAFNLGQGQGERDKKLALESPALAVLGTDSDTPEGWLACGQALAGILLRARSGGFMRPSSISRSRSPNFARAWPRP